MLLRTPLIALAAALLAAGCVSNEPKSEAAPAPTAATTTTATPEAAPAAKPECPPEPAKTTKKSKKSSKKKTAAKAAPPPTDCEPAKPKTAAAEPAKAAEPPPAKTAAAPAAGQPRVVKSRDGTFEGEVYGNIPPNSKWSKLQIGMEQPEVERILGVSHLVTAYPTAKAFIPFYFGTDSTRYEVRYPGQGSVSYTGGSWGGGHGVLMMINYDPKTQ